MHRQCGALSQWARYCRCGIAANALENINWIVSSVVIASAAKTSTFPFKRRRSERRKKKSCANGFACLFIKRNVFLSLSHRNEWFMTLGKRSSDTRNRKQSKNYINVYSVFIFQRFCCSFFFAPFSYSLRKPPMHLCVGFGRFMWPIKQHTYTHKKLYYLTINF